MFNKIQRIENLSPERFKQEFIGKKSVIFTEHSGKWNPFHTLKENDILSVAQNNMAKVRPRRNGYLAAERITKYFSVEEYFKQMHEWYDDVKNSKVTEDCYPPYLHDTPLLKDNPNLIKYIQNFPLDYLPKWYHELWYKFCLFFIGPSKGTTPMHFDSCETNNLFFQVSGKKRFIVVPNHKKLEKFRVKWQWSTINAEKASHDELDMLHSIGAVEANLSPNDILYMPPRTWHQVKMIEPGISFNIDWHTKYSSFRSLLSLFRKSPIKNALNYNLPLMLGLCFGIPSFILFAWIEKHLDFVD